MSEVLSQLNMSAQAFNSPTKNLGMPPSLADEGDDKFSFKLTQIPQKTQASSAPALDS